MSISRSRIWLGGGAALCILMLVAGWFLLIQPKRADAAQLREQVASQRQDNDQARAKVEQLKAQFASLPAKKAELAKIHEAMPADVAEASLQRELDKLAKGSGTTVLSVTDGEQEPFVSSSGSATGAATSTASADATSADSGSGAAAATSTAPGVTTMKVTIDAMSTFAGSQAFLQKLQDKMPRAFLVTGLTLTAQSDAKGSLPKPSTKNGDVEINITGNVFILDTDGTGSVSGGTSTASSTAN